MKDVIEYYLDSIEDMIDDDVDSFYQQVLEDVINNDANAFYILGRMYFEGHYVNQDYEKAFRYFKFACAKSEGDIDVGVYSKFLADKREELLESKVGKRCYIDFLEYLVENGDYNAAIILSSEYGRGEATKKNVSREIELLELAKDHGITYAYDCLGELYFLGEDVEQDYKKAYEYFTMTDGYSFMQLYYLGEMYRGGCYVEKDINKAVEYYKILTSHKGPYDIEDMHYCLAKERLAELGISC